MADEKSLFISDCPRCGARRITFDLLSSSAIPGDSYGYTIFCRCRDCFEATNFQVSMKSSSTSPTGSDARGYPINVLITEHNVQHHAHENKATCPAYVPDEILAIFDEAAICLSIGCFSAAGTMFRKVLDRATRTIVPSPPEEVDKADPNYISHKTFRDLRLRLDWLIERELIPSALVELVDCVREDGNDAAHALEDIGLEGATDLQDFAVEVLEALFTVPGKIAENVRRRIERREGSA